MTNQGTLGTAPNGEAYIAVGATDVAQTWTVVLGQAKKTAGASKYHAQVVPCVSADGVVYSEQTCGDFGSLAFRCKLSDKSYLAADMGYAGNSGYRTWRVVSVTWPSGTGAAPTISTLSSAAFPTGTAAVAPSDVGNVPVRFWMNLAADTLQLERQYYSDGSWRTREIILSFSSVVNQTEVNHGINDIYIESQGSNAKGGLLQSRMNFWGYTAP